MRQKPGPDRKKFKKAKFNIDSIVESDEHLGLLVGHTSNGVLYELTHEEWNKIYLVTNKEKPENDNTGLPFRWIKKTKKNCLIFLSLKEQIARLDKIPQIEVKMATKPKRNRAHSYKEKDSTFKELFFWPEPNVFKFA